MMLRSKAHLDFARFPLQSFELLLKLVLLSQLLFSLLFFELKKSKEMLHLKAGITRLKGRVIPGGGRFIIIKAMPLCGE